ncbi:hypothetical protein D6783_00370 [Candidatus Woesearchaeota archaeon]|nr:MAG: hypothetical protein D6783_00370 [Candidatus Woesearchaeota archaeon]
MAVPHQHSIANQKHRLNIQVWYASLKTKNLFSFFLLFSDLLNLFLRSTKSLFHFVKQRTTSCAR